jgi:leader peptidase (prepilin peptidase)/N-methyltransferase
MSESSINSGGTLRMMFDSIIIVFAFVFGLIVGSFLNVCIYRIPLKKSILSPPSSCPACNERIKFYDNIPLMSFIILGRRCRHCGQPITFRYPLVELITGLLSLAVLMNYPNYGQYFALFIFVSLLIIITFQEIIYLKILQMELV